MPSENFRTLEYPLQVNIEGTPIAGGLQSPVCTTGELSRSSPQHASSAMQGWRSAADKKS
jgi:hypothetical protein